MRLSLTLLFVIALAWPGLVQARSMTMRVQQVDAGAAQMQQVQVRLDWPATSPHGQLQLRVGRLDAPQFGYHWRDVKWQCPLQRDGRGGWQCDGVIRSGAGSAGRLRIHLRESGLDAQLSQGRTQIGIARSNAQAEHTAIDLTHVPVAWLHALARQGWADVQLQRGHMDAQLQLHTPANAPMRLFGPLHISGLALQNADASIAAESLSARMQLDYLAAANAERLQLSGAWLGGELLAGNTYVALPAHAVDFAVHAQRQAQGWALPLIQWRDPSVLEVQGSAELNPDASLRSLQARLRSDNAAPLGERYLSGWLGLVGLQEMQLQGGMRAEFAIANGQLQRIATQLQHVHVTDAQQRFAITDAHGSVAFSADAPVSSALSIGASQLYGLRFGRFRLPMQSGEGALSMTEPVNIPLFGGNLQLQGLALRPPTADTGLRAEFGLELSEVNLAQLASTFGLPEFTGRLNGYLPRAVYSDDVLRFDGGLSMALFDGHVQVSELVMERPFGTAPSLGADIDLRGIDLHAMTNVLDIGQVTGRMDGRIHGLRLLDFKPVAFDAWLHTVPRKGVTQRISQRAVQDISSVGDASFVTSVQGQLIGLFDDFGYAHIGIGCRLANQVCAMSGLDSDTRTFTIVKGRGLPRLDVIGYNRQVDWPTLVQRLADIGKGDSKPVIE